MTISSIIAPFIFGTFVFLTVFYFCIQKIIVIFWFWHEFYSLSLKQSAYLLLFLSSLPPIMPSPAVLKVWIPCSSLFITLVLTQLQIPLLPSLQQAETRCYFPNPTGRMKRKTTIENTSRNKIVRARQWCFAPSTQWLHLHCLHLCCLHLHCLHPH